MSRVRSAPASSGSSRGFRGKALKQFWVVGGEYTDTHFAEILGGGKEHRFGPYRSMDEAQAQWQKRSWPHVDNCNVRYRIVETEDRAAAPHRYWVVGGEYTGTDFKQIVGGGDEDWFGPYATMEEAVAEWQRESWLHVDNCNARYRIVEAPEPVKRGG